MRSALKGILPLAGVLVLLNLVTAGIYYLAATKQYRAIEGLDSFRAIMFVLMAPLLLKYAIQLAGSPFYSIVSALRGRRATMHQTPSVSVIIPAWNEEVGIVKTIQSVLDTRYPRLQIVVANDGSTDGTHEKVTAFIADYERSENQTASITYLEMSNGGKASAMNRALLHVDGEIIVTIDADSAMDPDAIVNLVRRFDDPAVGAVAGNVVVGNRKKPIEWMQQMEYLSGFYFKRTDSLFGSVYIIGGAAAAYRRSVLQEMGGFDHSIITEDMEMSMRILDRGYKTRYAADAVVYTEGPSDLTGLCNQRLRWVYGRLLTFIKYKHFFFSLRRGHRPYLTFLLLPMAIYANLFLLFEAVILFAFLVYTVTTCDYVPVAFMITQLAVVVTVQILTDPKRRFHANLILLAPSAWLMCYVMDMVELQALLRSLKRLFTRQGLQWQRWVRVGLLPGKV